ncbi:MAG: alpha/beta hydrolase [Candidatus Binataceae bacterium]
MEEITLGHLHVSHMRPAAAKFAVPIVVLSELFATTDHLAALIGYLVSLGWEVYAPDLRRAQAALGNRGFIQALELLGELPAKLGREFIVVGHGIGGLLALKLAERKGMRAAVAFAPLVPGVRTPIYVRMSNLRALWGGGMIRPPRGPLAAELFASLDQFRREKLASAMVPEAAAMARDVARGRVSLGIAAVALRLIIAGETDRFAPIAGIRTMAERSGSHLATLAGCGHWLIEGRALEPVISEMQRFLVRELGEQLLLLYSGGGSNCK